jgi:translation initiation factor IF-2-like protein
VVFGPRELRNFFVDEDLGFLMGDQDKVWSPGFRNSSRPDFFLDTLEILEVDWKAFVAHLGDKFNSENSSSEQLSASHQWLKRKMAEASSGIEWLRSFYLILLKADKEIRTFQWAPLDVNLRRAAVVLTDTDFFLAGGAVYFETGSVALPGVSIATVHPDVIAFEQKQVEKAKQIRAALGILGVKDYDQQEAIGALISKISAQRQISRNEHLAQMRCLLEWFRAGKILDFSDFSNAPMFLDVGQTAHRRPAAYYIDAPFRPTGLKNFFIFSGNCLPLWPGYAEHFDGELFAAFAEKTGVLADIPFREVAASRKHPDSGVLFRYNSQRRTDREINQDWIIDGLDDLFNIPSVSAYKMLWEGMGRAQPRVLQACYRPNAQYALQSVPSSLVHALREKRWVLKRDGSLNCPRDVTAENLAEGWQINGSNGWLTAVKFGASAADHGSEQKARADAAQQLGIAPELVEELHALSPVEQQDLLARVRESKAHVSADFPSDDRPVSEGRTHRAEAKARQASPIRSEVRERRIRISSDKGEVRTYLSEKYHLDRRLYCQMSHQPMPFDLPSGNPFFEAVPFLALETENAANYLCLSPTCAAEFKHSLQMDEETLRARVQALDANLPSEQLAIPIEVPLLQHRSLRFRRSHLTDLQAALRVLAKPTGSSAVRSAVSARAIQVQEPATVQEVATLLGVKPFRILADLMTFGAFKNMRDELSRHQIEKLASKQGFTAHFVRKSNDR